MANVDLEDRIRVVGGKGAHLEWLRSLSSELGYVVPDFDVIDTGLVDAMLDASGASKRLDLIRGFAPQILSGEYDVNKLAALFEKELVAYGEDIASWRYPYHVDRFKSDLSFLKSHDYMNSRKEFISNLTSNQLNGMFRRLPADLMKQLTEIHAAFSPQQYALRSSATCEDSEERSFAGRFLTRLPTEVRGWSGLAGSRYVRGWEPEFHTFLHDFSFILSDFIFKKNYSEEGIMPDDKMAVVVQHFVHTSPSGIVFTQLSEESDILSIESTAGPCYKVADGDATCIIDFSRSAKKIVGVISYTGENPLSDGQFCKLVDVATELEKRYGLPLDIEFGFSGDVLHLFQARPVPKVAKSELVDLVRLVPEGVDVLAETPLCINKGVGEGVLVQLNRQEYYPISKTGVPWNTEFAGRSFSFDSWIGRDYILLADSTDFLTAPEKCHAWCVDNIHDTKCVGIVVAGYKYMSRLCHNSHYFRRSAVPVLGFRDLGQQLEPFLVRESPQGFRYSDVTFGVNSVGRRGIFYRK